MQLVLFSKNSQRRNLVNAINNVGIQVDKCRGQLFTKDNCYDVELKMLQLKVRRV